MFLLLSNSIFPLQFFNAVFSSFKNNKSLYIGEKVTIAEHMIQSAMIAEKSKSKDNLVCTCLLHDYGPFLLDDPDKLVRNNKDGKHEDIGYEYLKKFFQKEVVEPIKHHVVAKRYLARNKTYFEKLSKASKVSLELQGGILNDKDTESFKRKSYFKSSILLRKFDEAAKKTYVKMKTIHDYKKLLISKKKIELSDKR